MNYFWMFGCSLFLFTGFQSPVTFCQATPRLPSNCLRHVSHLGLTLPMYKHAVRPFTEEVARNARYKLQRAAESKVTKCFAEQRRRVMSLAASRLKRASGWREQPQGYRGKPGGGAEQSSGNTHCRCSASSRRLRSVFVCDSY